MDRHAPALAPAAALVAGALLAPHLVFLPIACVAALATLGIGVGRRAGPLLVGLALGLAAGLVRVDADAGVVVPNRPVTVEGRVVGHPVADEGWRFPFRVERLRQGRRVTSPDLLVFATLVADDPTWAPPAFGSRVRLVGYLGRPPGFANDPPVAPGGWRLRVESPRFVEVRAPPPAWAALAGRMRGAAERTAARVAGPTGASRPGPALARAVVLGDRSGLDDRAVRGVRRAGLAHLLAVSGLNVALVAAAVFFASASLPRAARLAAAALAVVVYLLAVGPQPSVLRAALMGLVGMAALVAERPPAARNALAVGVALMVLGDPAVVDDLGFRLSVGATLGLLLLGPPIAARLRALPRPLRLSLAASLGAELVATPLLRAVGGGFHPAAPLLNLVAIPWLATFLVASIVALAATAVLPAAAPAAAALLDLLASPVELLAALPAHPLLFRPLPVSGPAVAAGIAVALALFLAPPRRGVRLATIAVLALSLHGAPADRGRETPEAIFLDVGQGDATLVRDGPRAVLVDGGGWPRGDFGGRVIVPALAGAGLSRLDAVVLSHGDRDHCRGLVDLVAYLPVAEIWTAPEIAAEPCAAELVASPGPRWRPWRPGEERSVGRWRLRALHPPAATSLAGNDGSLVLLAATSGRRLLLTGDVGEAGEAALVARFGDGLHADVLKVAHHGSRGSTSEPFLRRVRPRLAVVSAGRENPYGHPAAETLARLRRATVPTLRTDRDGAVRLRLPPGGPLGLELPGAPRGPLLR